MLLRFLRKKKNMKRIMWALAILIIPAFVIWGAGSAGRKKEKGPGHAGEIFGRKVSFEEYLDMWQTSRDYAIRTFGTNLSPEFIDQLAWNRILLLEKARTEKIAVKDSEVIERILSFPIFQREGVFDKALYKSMLGDGAKGFEEKIRDDILISKVREKITSGVSVTDDEVKDAYKKKFEKIKASYVSIPFSDFEKELQFQESESELVKFYEDNKEAFRRPEERNITYIEIPFSSFDKELFIEEEAIKRHFEENISDYKRPEPVGPDAEGPGTLDPDKMPELTDEIKKEIYDKLAAERKKSLAEELSYRVLDTVLDKNDLDEAASAFALETKKTGFFSMQEEVPGVGWSYEFTKKGFELDVEEISNVLIKTEKGFYIIQLKEKKEPYIGLFTDVRDSVIALFTKDRSVQLSEKNAEKIFMEISNKINTGSGLEDTVAQLGLELKETPFTTRDGYISGLGPAREFVERCAPLKNNEIAGPLKMQDAWVIMRLDGYEAIDEVKFLEEKQDFKEKLLTKKKGEEFNRYFEEFKEEANLVSYTMK